MRCNHFCMILAGALLGCARAPERLAPVTPRASPCAAAPITARWTAEHKQPTGTQTRLRLDLHIDVPGRIPAALRLTVQAPEGASLVGVDTRDLGHPSPGTVLSEVIEVVYPSTPTKDLVVELDARDGDEVAHVTLTHRFGRPAPVAPSPALTGPPLVIGGVDFGPVHLGGLRASQP
jgi:hypothetical protein